MVWSEIGAPSIGHASELSSPGRRLAPRQGRRAPIMSCLLALLCSGLVLLVAAESAGAARAHAFSQAFPSVPGGEIALSLDSQTGTSGVVSGVAASATSHDVYVTDTGNRRIAEFSSSGLFIRAWGWGVATGASELQTCTAVCQPGLSGEGPGEFELPTSVAVDNDASSASFGDVYVGDSGDNLVTKFDAEGHLISSWGNNGENGAHERVEPNGQLNGETTPAKELFTRGFPGQRLAGVAVDESGVLWVLASTQRLFAFSPGATFQNKCLITTNGASVGPQGIATGQGVVDLVDGAGGTWRVAKSKCKNGEDAEATDLTTEVRPATGLAIDTHNSDLYVDGAGALIEDLPSPCVIFGTLCKSSNVFGETGEGVVSEAAGVGVDEKMGAVYVANAGTGQILEFGLSLEATVGPATATTAHTSVLHAEVNPVGSELSRCEFEYGETESYGSVVECEESPASIGNGSSPVPVQASVKGLAGGTTYHFRLHVANPKSAISSEAEEVKTVKTAHVLSVEAAPEGASVVSLKAIVNPEGVGGGEYHFEFGDCGTLAECPPAGYSSVLPNVALAGGTKPFRVAQLAEGLIAGHTYHFRVVVSDENGLAEPAPEGTFIVGPRGPACGATRPQALSDGLPDCRGYEMITPPFKNGALVDNGAFMISPAFARNGSRVLATSIQCFHEPQFCVGTRETEGEPYEFQRTASGWLTQPMALSPSFAGSMLTYNADTGESLWGASPSPEQPEQLYVRRRDGGTSVIGPLQEAPGFAIPKEGFSTTLVATPDFSHLAYVGEKLWGFDETMRGESVYAYPGAEGRAVLQNVTGTARDSRSLIGTCGSAIGGSSEVPDRYGTITSDGRTVIVSVKACATGTGENVGRPTPEGRIYQRTEDAGGAMETVLVSGSGGPGVCTSESCLNAPPATPNFEGASSDGSRVFFTSTRQLTDTASEDRRIGDTAAGNACILTASDASGCNLYMWECADHCESGSPQRLVDVSEGDVSGKGPQVQNAVAVAPDGGRVYFVARGVLAGPNKAGAEPAPGEDNLYVYGPGEHGADRVAFIGTLAPSDQTLWETGVGQANVSPDGRFLVFPSHRGLTADVSRHEGPSQIYRYDDATERLVRVSIGQEGFDNNGNNGSGDARIVRSQQGFEVPGGRADPTMSDDGRVVAFESPVGLAPGALNDIPVASNPNVLAENVYAWEAAGSQPAPEAPACNQPGGCIWLISDGHDAAEGSNAHQNQSAVELLDVDASGANIFFETASQLVAGDTDSQVDFYDARVGGGFPASEEKPEVAVCLNLEQCHRPPAPEQPYFGGGGSQTLSGFENFIVGAEDHGAPERTTSPPDSPVRQLARALTACHHKPARARGRCERAARSVYRARMLVSKLADCRRKRGRHRAQCEHQAHKEFGGRGHR